MYMYFKCSGMFCTMISGQEKALQFSGMKDTFLQSFMKIFLLNFTLL